MLSLEDEPLPGDRLLQISGLDDQARLPKNPCQFCVTLHWRSAMASKKITKLAETVRLAVRTYDNGKQETARNLLALVASKIQDAEERQELNGLVESTIRQSGSWVYYKSIVFGASTAVTHSPERA